MNKYHDKIAAVDKDEAPSDADLDMHYETLMKAESIKGDDAIMKYLDPHMQKKFKTMKKMMGSNKKPKSIKELREMVHTPPADEKD